MTADDPFAHLHDEDYANAFSRAWAGADTLIEARVEGAPFVVRRPGKVGVKAGERVSLRWPIQQAHWFDVSSERRID